MGYRAWDQTQGVYLRRTKHRRRNLWAPLIRYTIDEYIFEVVSNYNEAYIEDMKRRVKPYFREWVPDESVWKYSDKKYLAVIKWLLSHHYGGYVEEWPELTDLDRMVRGMLKGAKTDAKKVWTAREIVL